MLSSLFVTACLVLGQVESPPPADDLQPTVRRLVRELNAPQLDRREAAERKLIERGPAVLDLLPRDTARTPAEVRQRLARIRQALQRSVVESAAEVSRVTLKAEAMPLSEALDALAKKTGNKIVDFRDRFGQPRTDPKLHVDFDQTPFWTALDVILEQADLSVYPYGESGALSVVARPEAERPAAEIACDSGPFRLQPLTIVARRDLGNPANKALQLELGILWEPRLQPISLRQRLADVRAVDESGRRIEVDGRRAELEVPVNPGATSVKLTLPFALPPREVKEIARLEGTLRALLPGRIETFRFSDLKAAQSVARRAAATTVTLERVRKNHEIWEVWIRVRFDQAGDALESHRGWILGNEAYLEGPDGKRVDNDGFETTRRTENEIGLAYFFDLEGPIDQYTFVYKTPGAILSAEFPYTLKGMELP